MRKQIPELDRVVPPPAGQGLAEETVEGNQSPFANPNLGLSPLVCPRLEVS